MDRKSWIKSQVGDRNLVIMDHLSRLTVWLNDKDRYYQAGPENDEPVPVASSPKEATGDALKQSFLTVCREKLLAELVLWNQLAEKLTEEEAAEGDARLTFQEILDFLGRQHSVSRQQEEDAE
jgi:hypothetical protein